MKGGKDDSIKQIQSNHRLNGGHRTHPLHTVGIKTFALVTLLRLWTLLEYLPTVPILPFALAPLSCHCLCNLINCNGGNTVDRGQLSILYQ